VPTTQPVAKVELQPATGRQPPTAKAASAYAAVTLKYLENSPIRVRGAATGREYEFSGVQPVQSVDAWDAEALLQTRFFQRIS
jgi:hypothetical protein